MKLWAALYLTIWIVLVEFLLEMIPLYPSVFPYLHLLLGAALVAVTYWNFHELRATRAPGRIKRVANATYLLALTTAVLGVPLFFSVGAGWTTPVLGISVFHVILFFHVLNAFAVITQTAAVAIAYDMWEEHEFAIDSEPGEVPPAPTPLAPGIGASPTPRPLNRS